MCSSYDRWKTTDPADEHMRAIVPKSTRLQCAADDAYVIAETIEALGVLLDRFRENHGDELASRLSELMSPHSEMTRVYAFARALEPVED